jgi:cellulase
VLDYIASCNGDCGSASPSSLLFTKMDQGAWISGNDPGTWVTDDLVKNNVSWSTTIPSNLAPGNYVIRHEIIALHAAGQSNGAQAYPQCVNFKVEGSGTQVLSGGVPATSFYKPSDAGILFNLYSKFTGYTIPGPSLGKFTKREMREHARDWI